MIMMHKRLDDCEQYFNLYISYISEDHCIKLDTRITTPFNKEASIIRESTNELSKITGEHWEL